MPMLRDGALENLGEGGKGATQWFMLHALERGLELRFYSEECGELRGVISVREIERVGPTDETAQFEVVLPDETYRLRAADAEDRAESERALRSWSPEQQTQRRRRLIPGQPAAHPRRSISRPSAAFGRSIIQS